MDWIDILTVERTDCRESRHTERFTLHLATDTPNNLSRHPRVPCPSRPQRVVYQWRTFGVRSAKIWNILFLAPRIKITVILNWLWSEFSETNEGRFDLLLQILITHWLSVTWPRYFYRSWSRIGCLWLDPDTSTDLDHALVVCDLTQILLQILITHWLSVTWPRYFYRSWSRIGCLWLDPDTSTDLDHALVVCDLTQIPSWIAIRDTNCLPSTPRSFRRYLCQVTDNQCNTLQRKLKITITCKDVHNRQQKPAIVQLATWWTVMYYNMPPGEWLCTSCIPNRGIILWSNLQYARKNVSRVATHRRGEHAGRPTECARDRPPPRQRNTCEANGRANTLCAAQPHVISTTY